MRARSRAHPPIQTRRSSRRRRSRPAAAVAAVRASWRGALAVGIALAVLVGVIAAALFLRTDRGHFYAAEYLTRDDARAVERIQGAIDGALTDLRVPEADRAPDAQPSGVRYTLVAQLPPHTWPVDANIALTQHLARIGATVWDAVETTHESRPAVQLTCGTHRDPLVSVIVVAPAAARDSTPSGAGALALILTDVDWTNIGVAERFAQSMHGVAAAVIPGERKSSELADRLARAGAELLVFLPMEPKGYPAVDPGPDPILVDMKADVVRDRARAAVRKIRGAAGVVNRMGSLAMQDLTVMRTLMSVAADERLFFVEMPSSPDAVTRRVGREIGVAVIPADAALDARKQANAPRRITGEVASLVARAHSTGRAVATVHADSLTCECVLRALRATHVRLTRPSESL